MVFAAWVCLMAQLGADAANIAATQTTPVVAADLPQNAADPTAAFPVIPALTPVRIRFEIDLGSKISTTGDFFPITLAAPIVVNGKELVPAGAQGQGEVIHAKKAGGGGAGGELVLAARFVEVGGRRLRLRSLRAGIAGRDAIHEVDAMNAASVLAPVPIGLLGFAVGGKQALYPKGTVAEARTAEAFELDRATNSDGPADPVRPQNGGD